MFVVGGQGSESASLPWAGHTNKYDMLSVFWKKHHYYVWCNINYAYFTLPFIEYFAGFKMSLGSIKSQDIVIFSPPFKFPIGLSFIIGKTVCQ
jgi:hypothetical protein